MFRWISGMKKKDRIRNKYVIGSICVVLIADKMRENKLSSGM
jgi:hypothetical protein